MLIPSAQAPTIPPPVPAAEVVRPPEGLARGVWEAPVSAFYATGGALVLGLGLFVARRLGLFSRRRTAVTGAPSGRGTSP